MRAEQNELLTRVGPGTPCGALLRSYWQPVALLDEFDPKLAPAMQERPVKAVRAMGQDLVLFMSADRTWGLLDRNCPHRGADLSFGRHEGDGLRCPFHGWKFDTAGKCLETPAEPTGSRMCERVRQRSYPVLEKSGILFAWFGDEGSTPPPLPGFDCFAAPGSHTFAFKGLWNANWLQCFEVGIDPAHPSFLHRFLKDVALEEVGDNAAGKQFRSAAAGEIGGEHWPMTRIMREFHQPEISYESQPWGLQLTALRTMTSDLTHVRVTQAIFPHTFVIPLSETMTITQMHVPVDDTHTYWYAIFTSFAAPVDKEAMRNQRLQYISLPDYLPKSGRHNAWGFNPEEQRSRTFLGMGEDDINVHDQWAVESMGAIQDRTREHLATSDKVIMAHRRMLLKAIETVQAGGMAPGVADASQIAAMTGPDTVDGIAPAGAWPTWWREQVQRKRDGAPWSQETVRPEPVEGPAEAFDRLSPNGGLMAEFFARRCGIADERWQQSLLQTEQLIAAAGIELVRFAWCDLHGVTRGKTLVASAAGGAMRDGVGMVSTLMLKDTSDRTAFKVFEPGGAADLPGFEFASNLLLMADPASFRQLPWTPSTGWVRGQPWFQDGRPVELDTRRVLERALERLHARGLGMQCGLEIEFHIYRIDDAKAQLDPELGGWPGLPPAVSMIHPGYNLLTEAWFDMAEEPMRIVQRTAQALGLPLLSLEVELGPSQVEAVFEPTDAMTAADNMVLFRNGVRQALRRAGYHATFMCRPPFPDIMSSGWHLHQSLTDLRTGGNVFRRDAPAPGSAPCNARYTLSETGEQFLAGLLEHARASTVFCTPTANGFGRFRPNALAPQSVLWGRDNRGAMLRVIGQCGDAATRIENRIGEPAANPYLYLASQIHCGLDGIERRLTAPRATDAPYGDSGARLPTTLGDALEALQADSVLCEAFGRDFIDYLVRIKQSERVRFEQAKDADDFQRREYFSRI